MLLLALAAGLVWQFVQTRSVPEELIISEQRLSDELRTLSAEEARLRATLNAPEAVDVYDRSYFLNQLLRRKGISWTKTFADIERILPPRVLMMQIRPEVTFDNKVELEMRVGAETRPDFLEFLTALETSEVFGRFEVHGFSPPNDNEPYYRYDLTVSYDQQL